MPSHKKMPRPKKTKSVRTTTDKKLPTKKAPAKKKPNPEDGIAKSRQLVQKLRTTKYSNSGSKTRGNNNNEVRLCGNGKPMPTLAELEKMFEDSDSDEETKEKPKRPPTPKTPQPPEILTPEKDSVKLISPKTIEQIANKMLDFVASLADSSVSPDDDGPPPPIIKPKKRKPTEIPYIVGCTERPYVPQRPNVSVFKGDEKYGPDSEEESDDDIPRKRAKRTKKVNMSKSAFNAMSDEIATRLKDNDDGYDNSDKSVAYVVYNPNTSGTSSFCPLPSTSKDKDTFVKNDELFNESFASENISKTNIDDDYDDVKVIETPCETIVINDTFNDTKPRHLDSSLIEILDDGSDEVPKNVEISEDLSKSADDSVQVIDVKPALPLPEEDYYSSLNTAPSDIDYSCEIIDVDDIIAESSAVVEKYCKNNNLNKVTLVDVIEVNENQPNTSKNNPNGNESKQSSLVNDNTQNATENNVAGDSNNQNIISNQNVIDLVNLSEAEQHRHTDNDNTNCQPSNTGFTSVPSVFNGVVDGGEVETHSIVNNFQNTLSRPIGTEHIHTSSRLYKRRNRRRDNYRFVRGRGGLINYRNRMIDEPHLAMADFVEWCSSFGTYEARANSNRLDLDKFNTPQKVADNVTAKSPVATSTSAIQNQNTGQQNTTSTESRSKGIGDCAICMDTMSNKSVASTMCGHLFCMECIKLSVKSNGKKCPTCRKALKPAPGYHQIFL